ncbi:MAG: hypothetical protein OJF49_001180 [Ktedonobacterales bacterium]|nr:MAG: hypothetical protein OJF49_001180 [Ktedonobacterales bacterium]
MPAIASRPARITCTFTTKKTTISAISGTGIPVYHSTIVEKSAESATVL